MQVLTLDTLAFQKHAEHLAGMVKEGSPKKFDAIVAIRRGGSFVCDEFCNYFPRDRYSERYDISLQRPSTKRKNKTVSAILKRIPLPILNLLRMAESNLLSFSKKIKGPAPKPDVMIPEGLHGILSNREFPKILIIDDAIDSGDTLYAITETLKGTNRHTAISIAVMTVTTSHPRIQADYSLYRNRTLIRFPWSNDYKTH